MGGSLTNDTRNVPVNQWEMEDRNRYSEHTQLGWMSGLQRSPCLSYVTATYASGHSCTESGVLLIMLKQLL